MLLRGGRLGAEPTALAGLDEAEGEGDWLFLFPHDEGVDVSSGARAVGATVVGDSILSDSIFTDSIIIGAVGTATAAISAAAAVTVRLLFSKERVADVAQVM